MFCHDHHIISDSFYYLYSPFWIVVFYLEDLEIIRNKCMFKKDAEAERKIPGSCGEYGVDQL
jgi:hypothetical protein